MLVTAILANLLGAPLLVFVLASWARVRALSGSAADPRAQWFPFARRLQAIGALGILASLFLCTRSWTSGGYTLAFGWNTAALGIAGNWALLFAPSTAIPIVLAFMTHDVARRLGTSELTRAEVGRQVMWSTATFFSLTFGLCGCVSAAAAAVQGRWVPMVLWLLFMVVGSLACTIGLQRAIGLAPHAVSHGDLRDRLFALAAAAGVRLRQLYVLPMKRVRMANAFAVRDGVVLVTDLLLESLSPEEVDAVMAHEIGHLRHGHPEKLRWVRATSLAIPMVSGIFGGWGWLLATLPLTTLGSTWVSRRFERTADREVTRLGASRVMLITGLVKLAKLGHVPLRWSGVTGWFMTHPSVAERAESAAIDMGVPLERAKAWLEPIPPPSIHYRLPEATLPEGRLFSTPFKHGVLLRNMLLLLGVSVVVPALLALASRALGDPARGWCWLAALVLAPLACVATLDFAAVAPLRALGAKLAARLGPGSVDSEATLVGLAPHAEPRVYEGFANWDLGFVRLRVGRLEYRGELCEFALSPAQVACVELASGPPHWIATRVVRIRWRAEDGVEHALRLTPFESARLSGITPRSAELFARVERWWKSGTAVAPGACPPSREVTCLNPGEMVKPVFYSRILVLSMFASLVTCGLLGLPVNPMSGMGLLEVLVTAFITQAVLTVPMVRYREAKAAKREEVGASRAAA